MLIAVITSDDRYLLSVLFSEPKIPQSGYCRVDTSRLPRFQCSSASRKFLNSIPYNPDNFTTIPIFQCSSASRKFLNLIKLMLGISADELSVLFSEPKIPQSGSCSTSLRSAGTTFSALQRAENSSIQLRIYSTYSLVRFQCSSASRKFLNWT